MIAEHVKDAEFKSEVLDSKTPVLVDFWADWCGPCHIVAPEVEAVGKELSGQLRVVKLDVDENPETAETYHVHSIPTLILFANGQERHRIVGARPRTVIRKEIEPFLQVDASA